MNHVIAQLHALGVQKGLVGLFSLRKLPRPERMHALMRPFRPWRSVACWYLWRLNEEQAAVPRR